MTLATGTIIGRRVRDLRERAGLGIDALAAMAGLSGQTLRNLERGRFVPAFRTLEALSIALGVKLSSLVDVPPRKRAS